MGAEDRERLLFLGTACRTSLPARTDELSPWIRPAPRRSVDDLSLMCVILTYETAFLAATPEEPLHACQAVCVLGDQLLDDFDAPPVGFLGEVHV